jgi:hypothetical protein
MPEIRSMPTIQAIQIRSEWKVLLADGRGFFPRVRHFFTPASYAVSNWLYTRTKTQPLSIGLFTVVCLLAAGVYGIAAKTSAGNIGFEVPMDLSQP